MKGPIAALRRRPRLVRVLRAGCGVLLVVVATLVVLCAIPRHPKLVPMAPRESTRYWPMSGGYRIAYTRVPASGGVHGAPIVFLHGGPGGYIYRSTIDTMGRFAAFGHDVYLYDQVGSGLSDRRPRPRDYSFVGHLADLHEIVTRHLRARKVILIGQSYGGVIVAHFLSRHADLVERAVLTSPGTLDPPPVGPDGKDLPARRYPVPPELRFRPAQEPKEKSFPVDLGLRAVGSAVAAMVLDRKLAPDAEADGMLNDFAVGYTVSVVCDPRHVQPEEGGMGFYSHLWSNWFGGLPDPRPALRRVQTPVLVLQGECDFFSYSSAYEYVDLLPHAEYHFVPGAGHEIWWDEPEAFVAMVSEFLRRGEPGAAAPPR